MAYQSLYRRYRPGRFSDLRGQEHVVRALRNAVRDEKVGHAYLFTGPRGTGKTSTARILAKALNCENLQNGEPDGTCESCLAIDGGTSYDVQELDAASNNGVADVRDLIGRVNLGSPGRTKVYILDEVHMLTAQASAALLKTLEEPPAHVVFVLATTDPQKVLPTIKSRTQQYDFHLLSADELAEHVAWVIHDAGLDLDPGVIDHVVRQGAGSARDTLSALDQVAAAGGVFDEIDSLDDLLDAVADGNGPAALVAVAEAVSAGRDPRVLGEALLGRFRDVFLVRMGGAVSHLPSDERTRVEDWAERLGPRATTRALELVGDALAEMRNAPDPRIPLEVALVKITRSDGDVDLTALLERVRRLEEAIASGATVAPAAPAPERSAPGPTPGPAPSPTSTPATESPTAPGPGRPAPPPVPGRSRASGGVAAAREALARAQRGEAAPEPASPTAPAPSAPSAPSASAPPVPEPRSAEPVAPTTAPPTPEPADTTPAAAPAGGSPVDLGAFVRSWNERVIPELRGATKAMFNVGELTAFDGTTATLSLPNDVHRQKCEQRLADVEAVLHRRIGTGLRLRLVVGDHDGRSDEGSPGPGADRPRDDYDLADIDVDTLEDAPDEPTGGIDALTEAFPGAEFVEE